jgi:UDP-glucose 4-epimerase
MTVALVTGGAGFIGSHLVDALLERGDEVRVFDDFSTGKRENLRNVEDQIDIIPGSITEPDAIQMAARGADLVFHLAALPSVQRSVRDPATTHAVCATGTLNVLEAARLAGVRRVVYAASSSAYGDIPGTVRTEDDPVAPISPYGVAKLAGEMYCRSFTKVYGLETARVRYFNIFGPRQDANNPYSGVIALFIRLMSEGREPTIFGDGLQSRDFTFVGNAVQATLKAAAAPAAVGNVYNVGTGGSISVLDLVRDLNEILGTGIAPRFAPARPGDIKNSQADIAKARRDLGYVPRFSFFEGLRQTVRAYLDERLAGESAWASVK